jgi:uncharacterized protein (DUF433 family)
VRLVICDAGPLIDLSQPVSSGAGNVFPSNRSLLSSILAGETTVTGNGQIEHIEIDPRVMLGKPVIRGTRITVELVLRKLSEGATEQALLDAYPRLTVEDIRAAIGYAADVVGHEDVVLVSAAGSVEPVVS